MALSQRLVRFNAAERHTPMQEVLTDLSNKALAKANHDNFVDFWSYYGRAPQAELHDGPETLWFVTGIPYLMFNGVIRARFEQVAVDVKIDSLVDYFKSRKLPMHWFTGPETRPADLGRRLEARGLTRVIDMTEMAADLRTLNEQLPEPPGLTIEPVVDIRTLEEWVHVASISFGTPKSIQAAFLKLEVSLGLGPDLPRRRYLARLHGEPVASSMLFVGAGVAGIYRVATVPEARRQGIGAAVTLEPLRQARAMGYRVGVLQSSPKGLNLYRRIGFQEYD